MSRQIRVGAVHASGVFMDTDASIEKATRLITQASADGVRLLVFPEAFAPGYPYWLSLYPIAVQVPVNVEFMRASIEVPGPEIQQVQAAAREGRIAVVLGISERLRGTSTCFNTQVFIDDRGTIREVHRKLQPTGVERVVWSTGGGATLTVHELAGLRVGGLACWENTMNLARQSLVEQGEQLHAASWPGLAAFSGNEHNRLADQQIESMMRSHALTGQTFVVAAGSPVDQATLDWMHDRFGSQQDLHLGGGWSAVIHPQGRDIAGPHTGSEERIVSGEVDIDDIAELKFWVDSSGHYSRPEVATLHIDRKPIWHDEPFQPVPADV